MPFWQRLLITVVAMLVASLLAGLLWVCAGWLSAFAAPQAAIYDCRPIAARLREQHSETP